MGQIPTRAPPHKRTREAYAYPRVWGINVGKIEGKIRVEGVLNNELDDNEMTATTANLTTLVRDLSDSDSGGEEDFSAENRVSHQRKCYIMEMVR